MQKMSKNFLYGFLTLVLAVVGTSSWQAYKYYFYGYSTYNHKCGDDIAISVPFEVDRVGEQLSCVFNVDIEDQYVIYLVYPHKREGGLSATPEQLNVMGQKIGLEYSIYNLKDVSSPLLSVRSGVKRIATHDGRGYWAQILNTKFSKGRYRLDIKSLNEIPALKNIKSEILIIRSSKVK